MKTCKPCVAVANPSPVRLDYDLLEGSFLSITQGPPLVPAWGTGYFAGDYGYRFPAGKGLQLDQDEDGCMNDHIATNATNAPNMAYSILMRARFDTPWAFVFFLTTNF